jgi:Protein of unknown function (DUF1570)
MDSLRPAPLRPKLWPLVALGFVGCATLGDQGQPLVPTRYETRTGPYAVYSSFPLKPDAPAVRSLQTLERDIEQNLGLRVRAEEPSVRVYILNDRQSFSHFLKFYYPELPPRRAFFLAQGPERVVYTFMGDRLEEDLRHEATHALLHVAVGDLPLWLDEGLAEYFEGPDGRYGRNPEHLGRLPQDRSEGWTPDLGRLETLKSVGQMTPRDYRESWAWIHYLLNQSPATKTALLGYLADLHANPKAAPLSGRLKPIDAGSPAMLLAHIDRVRALPEVATPTVPTAEPTIRLQDNAIELTRASVEPRPPRELARKPTEPARDTSGRRSFFDRFFGMFGLD